MENIQFKVWKIWIFPTTVVNKN